jgi:magnesium transporter
MPVVAAMGGNAGVQSSAIIVQGLANNTLKSKNISPKLVKEFFVSLLNGAVCSIIMFAWNLFIGHTMELSLTVSVALITVIIFASILGTLTPLLLEKFKIDPALATGPFITTTNDVVGLGFYFLIGRLILNHMI